MAKMTLASSADLLNETDAMMQKMRWLEFQIENAWDYIEGEWNPGKPIHKRPKGTAYGQQHIRDMFEIYDPWIEPEELQDSSGFRVECQEGCCEPEPGYDVEEKEMRCQDCMVWWLGDAPCWVCGEKVRLLFHPVWDMSNAAATWPARYDELAGEEAEPWPGHSALIERGAAYIAEVIDRETRQPLHGVDFDGETYVRTVVSTPRRNGRSAALARQMTAYQAILEAIRDD